MAVRKIQADDPFVARWLAQRPSLRENAAWTFEAARRYGCLRAENMIYDDEEQTWAWTLDMLEALHDMPVSGDLGKLDPQGPGFGFHVFEDPFQNLACYLRERRLGSAAFENAIANNRALMDEFERTLPNSDGHFVRMLRISQRDGVQGWAHMEKRKKLEHHVIIGPDRELARGMLSRLHPSNRHPTYDALACKIQALLTAKAATSTEVAPPRHMRRQAKRELGVDMSTRVRVVKWRLRPEGSSGGRAATHERQGVAAHSVRGHKRQQWYPSEQRHREIYIAPHRRGDEGIARTPVVNAVRKNADGD